jgi:hypothetical protein
MSQRNYLVNVQDLSLSDKREYKLKALAAGLERCEVKGIGNLHADIPGLESVPSGNLSRRVDFIYNAIKGGKFPESIDQRELVTGPARSDFVVPATALDTMVTAPLAFVGLPYSCFQGVAAPQLLINRLVVFWGVSVNTVPLPVSWLIFRTGGALGNVKAMFDFQTQETRLEFDAYMSEPVVYDPQEVFAVQVLASIAIAAAAQVHVHNFLFGPAGQTVL